MQKAADPVTIQLTPEELEAIINRAVAKTMAQPKAKADVQPAKWITKQEAAALARISKRTVDARINSGAYRISKTGTSRTSPIRVLYADVVKYFDNNMITRRDHANS